MWRERRKLGESDTRLLKASVSGDPGDGVGPDLAR